MKDERTRLYTDETPSRGKSKEYMRQQQQQLERTQEEY